MQDTDHIDKLLEKRMGRIHARLRLGIESESGHKAFGGGINFFHPENLYSSHAFIKFCLKVTGFYHRGVKNARNLQVRKNNFYIKSLPSDFEDFTMLHLSDLHVDRDWQQTQNIADIIKGLDYDICVLTGDYRAMTFGEYQGALKGMKIIADAISKPAYGVLGNHDSVRMVPGLEESGIQMLLNESVIFERGKHKIALAGIDDAHYFMANNLEKACDNIPDGVPSILLSHTPEIYRQATHAEFDIMLSGHTHGGQICLPGGIPLTLDSSCPRYMGSGQWRYHNLLGYTSVGAGTSIVNVRINCLPEVTLHRLTSIK